MRMKLRELFADVYYALDDLMYSKYIDSETFRELDDLVKTPLSKIINRLNNKKKNQNSGKSHQ